MPLAAALPDHPAWLETIVYQINGLIVVFVALGFIWGLLELMGIFFRRSREVRPRTAPVPAAMPESCDEISPELVAAITAAVDATLETPHRIMAVMPAGPELDWAQEGRRQIFASHKTR